MRVLALSSGTSVDAIDVALAELDDADGVVRMRMVAHTERSWPAQLRRRILAALPPAATDLGEVCRLDTEIGQAFADVGARAIEEWGAVDLVVSHGQTVHHWVEHGPPDGGAGAGDRAGSARGTLQLGSAAWIAARTGRPVIHDLRTADIAAGGQGAPLVSLLDALWLGDRPTAALNIGGIANITLVGDGPVRTGDTGPGNCLLDEAIAARTGHSFDPDGALAAAGRVDPPALAALLADPYYARPLPKSTGRETFDGGYVTAALGAAGVPVPSGNDLFATLTELTVRTIAEAIGRDGARTERVVVSGGGVRNATLMAGLRSRLPGVITSDALGLAAEAKEAYLFALLGYLSARGLPGTAPGVGRRRATGARSAVVLGSLTPPAPAPCPPGRDPVHTLVLEEG
ncbi:anhydro-N-acetylmuramic acid kinase [Occultella kanbiaonis]|uniref:anhydro-N-acetylmuramic acid kinase n=1 Tax=Occultella kanbiaonis TaxID=2675754 RepID=UPI0013D59479|nr:anhydro-N-acetylmuramic acid kinase [Occultella kanbiaonis]